MDIPTGGERSTSTWCWSASVGTLGALGLVLVATAYTVLLGVVAGTAEGLTPRWLAGLTTGLLGVGAGAAVLATGLGLRSL